MPDIFDHVKAPKAQQAYCDKNEVPMFAPHNGLCCNCSRDIYLPTNGSHGAVLGVTLEQAGNTLITSCPHCAYSFVE